MVIWRENRVENALIARMRTRKNLTSKGTSWKCPDLGRICCWNLRKVRRSNFAGMVERRASRKFNFDLKKILTGGRVKDCCELCWIRDSWDWWLDDFFRNYWILERLTLLNGGLNVSHQDLKLSCGRYLETLIQRSYWRYYTDLTK